MTPERKQRILCLITDEKGEYYYNGPLDGVWGPESQKAEERFLRDFTGEDGAVQAPPTPSVDFLDEIEYFDREEFRCQCNGKYCDGVPREPQEAMVRLANSARKHFGKAATVVSGLRCPQWNKIQGGVEESQHIYGEACDLRISGVTADKLLAWFLQQKVVRYAYKINGTNVHFDIPKGDR